MIFFIKYKGQKTKNMLLKMEKKCITDFQTDLLQTTYNMHNITNSHMFQSRIMRIFII